MEREVVRVALDRRTGDLAWSANWTARANYSSPGIREVGGERQLLVNHTDITDPAAPKSGLTVVRAADGKVLSQSSLDHGGDFLRCVRATDGQTTWEEKTYPGAVALVDGHLVASSVTAGLLRVIEASPSAYRERARLQVLTPSSRSSAAGSSGRAAKLWSSPSQKSP